MHVTDPGSWSIAPVSYADVHRLREELGVSDVMAQVLARRGHTDPAAASAFLHPDYRVHDPYLMAGMAAARARLDHALALWRRGAAPLIVVSGGVDEGLDEVTAMTAYLVGRGVPAVAVVPARPGATTRQTLRTLRRLGDRRYVAVSSPYHALRIRAEARRQGLRVAVSAPPSTPETRDAAVYRVRFASELFALVWYALPPHWTSRVATGPGTLRHVLPHVLAGRARPSALLTTRRREGSS